MTKYRVTLTERQLRLVSKCVEDCHRFAAGQTELWNTTSEFNIKEWSELRDRLLELQPLVTPELGRCASYGWSGGRCENKHQRKFIAETYPIYREILHFFAVKEGQDNVYSSETLTCEEGGQLPIIEEVNEE
ncbi:MAG: hypothetical protein MJZ12_00105 [Prevotella sp.]|nr:hypothetical protein [Prevotella sp.]